MADTDMDMDTPLALALDHQADDDLIDYDDDDLELGSTWPTQTDHGNSGNDTIDYDEDIQMSAQEQTQEEEEQEVHVENSPISADTQNPISKVDTLDVMPEDGLELEDIDTVDYEQSAEHQAVEKPAVSDGQAQEILDEIDYDFDDDDEGPQPECDIRPENVTHETLATEPTYHAEQQGATDEDIPGETTGEQNTGETFTPAKSPENPLETDQSINTSGTGPDEPDEDEITWEENEEIDEPEEVESVDHVLIPQQESNHGLEPVEEHESHFDIDQTIGDNNGSHALDAGIGATDHTDFGMQDDHSVLDNGSLATADIEYHFPSITVQYKGEEFPFFSSSSEGFFTKISMLDAYIEALFIGFREALEDDILKDDMLVFQVDELGLEFTESHTSGCQPDITMGKILNIFESLVKNQDSDSSRTLYTYLFVKPSPAKRFEYLEESAAAGKGLDEVARLFEIPVSHDTAIDESAIASAIYESEDYEHPADEANDDVEEGTEEDRSEGLENTGDVSDGDVHEATEEYQNGHPYDDGAIDVMKQRDDQDEVAVSTVEPAEEEYQQYGNGDVQDGDDTLTASEEANVDTLSQLPARTESAAPTESESNPFLNLELDEAAQEDAIDVNDDDFSATAQIHSEGVLHKTDTVDSSRTSTVKNEDEDEDDVDLDADQPNSSTAKEAEDELTEIDWHEAPNDELLKSSPAVKRARPDDELDVEGEQDAKRLRSSAASIPTNQTNTSDDTISLSLG